MIEFKNTYGDFASPPNGATITPVNNYVTWLACARVIGSYDSLNAVIGDTLAVSRLVNNDNAIAYMIRSTAVIMPAVVADATVMREIGMSPVAINAIIADGTWRTAILNSPNAIVGLDCSSPRCIPVMASNTTPYGECSGESFWGQPCTLFRGTTAGSCDVTTNVWLPQGDAQPTWRQYKFPSIWRQYKFPSPIWPYKVILGVLNLGAEKTRTMVLQVSNDGQNFTDISSVVLPSALGVQHIVQIPITASRRYAYYRLTNQSGPYLHESGTCGAHLSGLQVFGK